MFIVCFLHLVVLVSDIPDSCFDFFLHSFDVLSCFDQSLSLLFNLADLGLGRSFLDSSSLMLVVKKSLHMFFEFSAVAEALINVVSR